MLMEMLEKMREENQDLGENCKKCEIELSNYFSTLIMRTTYASFVGEVCLVKGSFIEPVPLFCLLTW